MWIEGKQSCLQLLFVIGCDGGERLINEMVICVHRCVDVGCVNGLLVWGEVCG